jgi:hypothetical protein
VIHFCRLEGSNYHSSPVTLGRLAIGTSNPLMIVEQPSGLTRRSMSIEVQLGDKSVSLHPQEVGHHFRWKMFASLFFSIDLPFAVDIVTENDTLQLTKAKSIKDGIVNI